MKGLGIILGGIFAATQLQAVELIVPSHFRSDLRTKKTLRKALLKTSLESEVVEKDLKVIEVSDPAELARVREQLSDEGIPYDENLEIAATNIVIGNVNFSLADAEPLLGQQWSLVNLGAGSGTGIFGADIDIIRAWTISKGKGRIYIVDSGVDPNSPELGGRLAASYDAVSRGAPPSDQNGHGTHVMSIAAAAEDGRGISGVAPSQDVEIVVVKILGADNKGNTSQAIDAYGWIKRDVEAYLGTNPNGLVVISNSWGNSTYSANLESAMAAVNDPRVIFVTSAGNTSGGGNNNDIRAFFPCGFRQLQNNICTAATDARDDLTDFSNFGPQSVHILAPGLNIYGNVPGHVVNGTYVPDWEDKSGTSQAAPHVSGAALLVFGANPNLTGTEVKNILLQSADRLPGAELEVISGGRLNAFRATLLATGQDGHLADRALNSNRRSKTLGSAGSGGCSAHVDGASDAGALYGALILLALLGLVLVRSALQRK